MVSRDRFQQAFDTRFNCSAAIEAVNYTPYQPVPS